MKSIQECDYDELAILALQKNRNERTQIEIFYMTKYFRQFQFFQGFDDEIVKSCCSKMRYEVLNSNQLIYKRFDQIKEEQKKFYIILQGELGIYLSIGLLPENLKDVEYMEISSIKMHEHFGHQLFYMTKEDIFEQYGLIIKAKKQTFVATLSSQYFHAYLIQHEERKMTYEISRLYDFCLFKEIQYKELKKFYVNSYLLSHSYKDKVFNQGDLVHSVYFILRGQYSIIKKTNENEIQILGIISEGEIIGEYEILYKIDNRPFSLVCQSEKGEILICDHQFFKNYVFQLIKDNLEQTIKAKFNFHQMNKTSIKYELNKLKQHIQRRQSIQDVCKQNKYHYLMRPIQRNVNQSNSLCKEKQSYHQLFVKIYNIASQQTQLANDERQRRISQYVKHTLKPMQQKLKQTIDVSTNKNDESITKNNKSNEMFIQALKRNNDQRYRRVQRPQVHQRTKAKNSLLI